MIIILKLFTFFLLNVFMCYGDYNAPENINVFLFGSQKFEFVDLSQSFVNQFSDRKAFDIERTSDDCANENLGTQIEVDYKNDHNIFEKQRLVHNISLKNLILPLIIADISDKVNGNENFVLYKHHLDYFLNNYFGDVHQPCLMVFKFGWSKYFNEPPKYCGLNHNNTNWKYPGISEEVAKWKITAYKNIVGVGVDLPSVDPGSSNMHPATKTLIDAGVYVLKNLKLDQYLPETSCTALAMPPKLGDTDSSPLRLVAICPKSRMQKPQILLHRI